MIEQLGTWMILRQLLTECAGLFWIWAEVLILYAVWMAQKTIRTRDISHMRRLRLLIAGPMRWVLVTLLLASIAVLSRHYFHINWLRQNARDSAISRSEELLPALARVEQQHILLWSGFVVLWVLLECAIVWQGWRVYRTMQKQLQAYPAA